MEGAGVILEDNTKDLMHSRYYMAKCPHLHSVWKCKEITLLAAVYCTWLIHIPLFCYKVICLGMLNLSNSRISH